MPMPRNRTRAGSRSRLAVSEAATADDERAEADVAHRRAEAEVVARVARGARGAHDQARRGFLLEVRQLGLLLGRCGPGEEERHGRDESREQRAHAEAASAPRSLAGAGRR